MSLLVVPHLISVLAEGPIGVHAVNSISLSFMFVEGLHHILNPPKFFLDADVLLAGRLSLSVRRKKKIHAFTTIITNELTLNLVFWTQTSRVRDTDA